ncbi:MAG: type II toxin-antitoxin system death-on-curing family toxin [Xanthobacteraceae bacterium]
MSEEPEWLTKEDVLRAHSRELQIFGGRPGVRDHGALESALGRPLNKWQYDDAELPELAAAYGFGIVSNHPFVDGNKRAGFLAMVGFLLLNQIEFAPDPLEATAIILGVAAGEINETGLARWIRDNWPKV